MRSTRTIVFGCALVAAALVFWGLWRAIGQANAPSSAVAVSTAAPGVLNVSAPSSGKIAHAATDIPVGSIVTPDMLVMKDYSGPTTAPFITDIDKQASGFITRVTLTKDSLIRPEDDFVGHISQVGIAGALRPGTRALVLPLPGKPTLHDLVKIGNSVDVLAAFDGQESRTIVENVRVLAVDVFANDYPQVNAAMRGPYKADKVGDRPANSSTAPGASGTRRNVPPDSVPPSEEPTPRPDNLPPLDPALTLEVTPQQAAAIQLALASQAPLDFLVRPSLPGNRSSEVTLVSDDGTGLDGAATSAQPIANSVTKRQIAPYAEAVKNRNGGAGGGAKSTGNAGASSGGSGADGGADGNSGRTRNASPRAGRSNSFPVPDFPPVTTTTSPRPGPVLPTPFNPANAGGNGEFAGNNNNGGERLAPRAPSTYQIPIYSDGGVVRTETVPVPIR